MAAPAVQSSAEARLATSSRRFVTAVWPLIAHKFGPGELVPTEGVMQRATKLLDFHGIDYMFEPTEGAMFGIGQRTQNTPRDDRGRAAPWNSFTMRPTEYLRLTEAMKRPVGQMLPAVLVQSFVSEIGDVVTVDSVGVVRTQELLQHAVSNKPRERSGPSGNFLYWDFDELANAGVSVDRFPHPSLRDPF